MLIINLIIATIGVFKDNLGKKRFSKFCTIYIYKRTNGIKLKKEKKNVKKKSCNLFFELLPYPWLIELTSLAVQLIIVGWNKSQSHNKELNAYLIALKFDFYCSYGP